MTIVIDETLVGMWYMRVGEDADWLGAVKRVDENTHQLDYRHRYYKDDRTDEFSQDEKRWYSVQFNDFTDWQMLEEIRRILVPLAKIAKSEVTEVLMHDGDVDDFIAQMSALPFAHIQEKPPGPDKVN